MAPFRDRFLAGMSLAGFIAANFVLAGGLAFPSKAFAFKHKDRLPREASQVSENENFRVVFFADPSTEREDSQDKKTHWIELNYKITDLQNSDGQMFRGSGGGKVRFLDRDGFALAADIFSIKDFEYEDLYGSLWIQKDRLKKIARADVVSLRSEELPLLAKALEKPSLPSPLPETSAVPGPQASPQPSPSVSVMPQASPMTSPTASPIPGLSPRPEASVSPSGSPSPAAAAAPSPVPSVSASAVSPTPTASPAIAVSPSVSPSPSSAPSTQISPSPTATPSVSLSPATSASVNPYLERGGANNEAVQKTLQEQNKNTPTAIPSSPSTIKTSESDLDVTIVAKEDDK